MIDQFTRNMRSGKIGSSDAAAACGMDDFKTPFDLWAEKTGRVPPFKGNDATEAGNYFESGLLRYLQDKLGRQVSADQFFLADDGIRAANLDGLVCGDGAPELFEGKTVGLFGPSQQAALWGDPDEGADAVPNRTVIQVHHAFGVIDDHIKGVEWANVVAFIGGRGFAHYRFRRNDDLVEAIKLRTREFHINYVTADVAPTTTMSPQVARALIRVPGKSVKVNEGLIYRWQLARAIRLQAEKYEEDAKDQILMAMGDAEIGTSEIGNLRMVEIHRKAYSVAESTYRKLNYKKAKGVLDVEAPEVVYFDEFKQLETATAAERLLQETR